MKTLHRRCAGLDVHLKTIEQLEDTIAAFDARIEAALEPFRDAIERLKEVPGLSETSAQILLAEIGTDMRQFPTAAHLLSWAGLIPRLDESAGKRRSTRVRKGAPWLKPVLVQCASAAARKKNTEPQVIWSRDQDAGPPPGEVCHLWVRCDDDTGPCRGG